VTPSQSLERSNRTSRRRWIPAKLHDFLNLVNIEQFYLKPKIFSWSKDHFVTSYVLVYPDFWDLTDRAVLFYLFWYLTRSYLYDCYNFSIRLFHLINGYIYWTFLEYFIGFCQKFNKSIHYSFPKITLWNQTKNTIGYIQNRPCILKELTLIGNEHLHE
jgi:hypothetical protein